MSNAWFSRAARGTAAVTAVAALLLFGCPLASERPLSDPATAVVDPALLGTWKTTDAETQETSTIRFLPFNGREMAGIGSDTGSDGEIAAYRVFATIVNGERFLNLQELREDGEVEWYFARYRVEGDVLTLRLVDDALFGSRTFASSDALRTFVQQNLDDPKLYGGTETEEPPLVWHRLPTDRPQ